MRVLLVAAIALMACQTTPRPTVTSAAPTATPVAIAETAASRTACAYDVLSSFTDAFNRGDGVALATFFGPDGVQPLQWFVTPETPAYFADRSRLAEFFVAWHASGERWRLVSVASGNGPSWHGGVDFAMRIERAWPDRSVMNDGKGALDCGARKIFAFALG